MTDTLLNKSEMPIDKLQHLRHDYLDLMQSCLTGSIYRDVSKAPFGTGRFNSHLREHGLDWPAQAQSMIGIKRMANLRALTESVIADNVSGDLIETGVWRGGACIMMRAVLYAYNITNRHIWVADSFEGLPEANEQQYPADVGSDFHIYEELAISLEQVQENFRAYDLLDEQVKFLKGWFKDTLPTAPVEQFALIRLDGDMYESTMDALTSLYPKLSHLGYVIIDDYGVVPACKAAVHDYCDAIGIQPDIIEIDGVGVYWRKFDETKRDNVSVTVNQTTLSPKLQISLLNKALAELSKNAIIHLEKSLAQSDDEANRLTQVLAEREVDVDRANQILVIRNSHIDELNQILADRNSHIDELNQILADRNSHIDELNQILADRNSHIDELNQILAALYSSTSWRLTKPVRLIKSIINGS